VEKLFSVIVRIRTYLTSELLLASFGIF